MSRVEALAIAIQTGRPSILWGQPGTGKTASIFWIGKALNVRTRKIGVANKDPTDIGGLPVPRDGYTEHVPPKWAFDVVREVEAEAAKAEAERMGSLLFFDELSTAPGGTQNVLLEVLLERRVGDDLVLPPSVWMIAAANPADQLLVGFNLTAPAANRLIHFAWPCEAEEWVKGMIAGWPSPVVPVLPANWRELYYRQMAALVAAYIKARPDKLQVLPTDETQASQAWPSGRTWDMTAECLAAVKAVGASEEAEAILVAGCIGAGAATEFLEWKKNADIPDAEEMLKDPGRCEIPRDLDKLLVALASVTAAVLQKNTVARWRAGWVILGRALRQTDAPDVPAVFAISLCEQRNWPKGIDMAHLPPEVSAFQPILQKAGIL